MVRFCIATLVCLLPSVQSRGLMLDSDLDGRKDHCRDLDGRKCDWVDFSDPAVEVTSSGHRFTGYSDHETHAASKAVDGDKSSKWISELGPGRTRFWRATFPDPLHFPMVRLYSDAWGGPVAFDILVDGVQCARVRHSTRARCDMSGTVLEIRLAFDAASATMTINEVQLAHSPLIRRIICPFIGTLVNEQVLTGCVHTKEELLAMAVFSGLPMDLAEAHINGNFANNPSGVQDVCDMEGASNEHNASTGINDCVTDFDADDGPTTLDKDCGTPNEDRFDEFFYHVDVDDDNFITSSELNNRAEHFPSNDFNPIARGSISGSFSLLLEIFGHSDIHGERMIHRSELERIVIQRRFPHGYVFGLPQESSVVVDQTLFNLRPFLASDRADEHLSQTNGYLEVKRQGQWGPVCDDSFDTESADVACREMGLGVATGFQTVNTDTDVFLMDDVACLGSEALLVDCPHTTNENCGSSEGLHVTCCEECGLRQTKGYLEVKRQAQWGPVCDDSFDIASADVACHQMGLGVATGFQTVNTDTDVFLMDDVACLGSEALLVDCPHHTNENCGSSEGVHVTCEEYGIRQTNGYLEVKLNRLHGWGPVCDDHFGTPSANVACRAMGLGAATGFATRTVPTNVFLMDDVACRGSERQLVSCPHTTNENCGTSEGVQVSCELPAPRRLMLSGMGAQSTHDIAEDAKLV